VQRKSCQEDFAIQPADAVPAAYPTGK